MNQSGHSLHVFKRVVKLMGNRFELSIVSEEEIWATERINNAIQEIVRIEKLLTTFSSDSQTNEVNDNAGLKAVKVDKEVFDLIARSKKISELTQGAFDITYGSIDKSLWNFDTSMTSLPNPLIAARSVQLINYRNIVLNPNDYTVYLKTKGMRIGFGGIGKGYAADMAKKLMLAQGVESGIVNASGDLITWGNQPGGGPWTIAIADPNQASTAFSTLNISNMAIATSGNYEKFVVLDGKKYSHNIDPNTGWPVTGIKSVTVLCPSAELADAMATPIMVMGVKVGLNMVNQLQNIACIIIDDYDRSYFSKNINVK